MAAMNTVAEVLNKLLVVGITDVGKLYVIIDLMKGLPMNKGC
jgi:hypothetical protein